MCKLCVYPFFVTEGLLFLGIKYFYLNKPFRSWTSVLLVIFSYFFYLIKLALRYNIFFQTFYLFMYKDMSWKDFLDNLILVQWKRPIWSRDWKTDRKVLEEGFSLMFRMSLQIMFSIRVNLCKKDNHEKINVIQTFHYIIFKLGCGDTFNGYFFQSSQGKG